MTQDDGLRWPNLFIVGAAKCGTTSLYHYLRDHPDVFMSPVKETGFFTGRRDRQDWRPAVPKNDDEYLALFADARNETYLGEGTPSYFPTPHVADRIKERSPDARIIIMLRDPVERAYSAYWMARRIGREERPFRKALGIDRDGWTPANGKYTRRSVYTESVRRYIDTFGKDQVHVMLLDDLKTDADRALTGLADFLGIDPAGFAAAETDKVHNPSRLPRSDTARRIVRSGTIRRFARILLPEKLRSALGDRVLMKPFKKPKMDSDVARRLADALEPDVAALEELLGRKLPELRRTWPTPE